MAIKNCTNDEDLVRSVQQGSKVSFSLLYERYLPLVYRRVCYSVPMQDVEDVTQEIFMAVFRSIGGFRFEARFSTWLRTLVHRKIAEYYQRRPQAEDTLPENLAGVHDPGKLEEIIVIKIALGHLPTHYQDILLLRFAEGMSFEEMANESGCSLEATKSLFRRALSALHKKVNQDA